jgi:hypothetical protein
MIIHRCTRTSGGYFETVDASNCEIYTYLKESKSCQVEYINSPYLESKSEVGAQDGVRSINKSTS